jgi:uncharacterized membrane protein YdfJ with MMPL/SSD domain
MALGQRGRFPLVGKRSVEAANPEGRFWGAIVRGVLRRPGLSLALSVALLLAVASPIFGMKIGTSGVTALPDRFESKQGFAALRKNFPAATADPVVLADSTACGPSKTTRRTAVALSVTLVKTGRNRRRPGAPLCESVVGRR